MDSSWNGRCVVRFQQRDMKHMIDSHITWNLELENHDIDLFHNEECT